MPAFNFPPQFVDKILNEEKMITNPFQVSLIPQGINLQRKKLPTT